LAERVLSCASVALAAVSARLAAAVAQVSTAQMGAPFTTSLNLKACTALLAPMSEICSEVQALREAHDAALAGSAAATSAGSKRGR